LLRGLGRWHISESLLLFDIEVLEAELSRVTLSPAVVPALLLSENTGLEEVEVEAVFFWRRVHGGAWYALHSHRTWSRVLVRGCERVHGEVAPDGF
jgi:hypothetical protein